MAFGDRLTEIKDPSQNETDFENYKSEIHEERLKSAPKIVRDYYNGTGIKFTKGLFKVLVASKGNRMIFLVMIFCFAIVFIKGQLAGSGNVKVVSGYECELNAFSYDDVVYANVKVHPVAKLRKEFEETGKQNIELKPSKVFMIFTGVTSTETMVPFEEKIEGEISDKTVFFRTSSPDYDIISLNCAVNINGESKELTVKVTHKVQ